MNDASKVALVTLAQTVESLDFRLIDCQVYSKHLQSLGAIPMQRELFINILNNFCNSAASTIEPRQLFPV